MHRFAAAVPAGLLLLAVAAAPAVAQEPPPSAPAPAPAPAPEPAPAPAPAAGTLAIGLEKVGGKRATVVAGDRIRVRGTVAPYVPGQVVSVAFYNNNKKVATKDVTVRAVGDAGGFLLGFRTRNAGRLVVRAAHAPTPELAALAAPAKGADVLPRALSAGARGTGARLLQKHLGALGYVIGDHGVLDARTQRAVLAFRKVTGMSRTTAVTADVTRRLADGDGAYELRFPSHGRHVEADLSRQVVVLAHGRKVERIYPTSSGAPATPTILGSFKVYRKDAGTNAIGMVYSSYFIRGYAIHGYHDVPTYSASHGCLRVPIPDAIAIFNWVALGTPVDVYP